MNKKIYQSILDHKERTGESLRAFCRRTGLSLNTLSHLKNDKANIKMTTYSKIMDGIETYEG